MLVTMALMITVTIARIDFFAEGRKHMSTTATMVVAHETSIKIIAFVMYNPGKLLRNILQSNGIKKQVVF
jgi:hypothetical protein